MQELCHDLIGPAATIKLLAEIGCQGADTIQAVRRSFDLISAEAEKISDICGYTLGRSRSHSPVRLDQLIVRQIHGMRMLYQTALEFEANPVLADVHPAIFARVIGNLLSNACQAASPDGLVRLTLTIDGDKARICVDDSGPGFTAERGQRICYGLQIVWSLVLDCGGSVQMGVSDLGGLHVAVTFPAARAPGAAASARKSPRRPAPQYDRADLALCGSRSPILTASSPRFCRRC